MKKWIFVISIKPFRRTMFIQHMKETLGQNIAVINGVDGRTLDVNKLLATHQIERIMKLGVIGCFMSHRNMWTLAQRRNLPYALIMEDDARWTIQNPKKIINGALKWLDKQNEQWDILLLGRNSRRCENGEAINSSLVRTGRFWGLFSYIISKKGIEKLLSHPSIQCINTPVDVLLSNLGILGYLNIIAFTPDICLYDKKLKSDTFRI